MEPINISFDNMESINISDPQISGGNDSLGVGIELLMNDKKKSSTPTIDVGDLNTLEDELNELTNINTSSLGNTEPLNSFSTEPLQPTMSIPIDEIKLDDLNTDSKLGSATANFVGQGSNNFMKQPTVFPTTNMSDREIRRKKRIMLKKMEEWKDKGLIKTYSNYTMESPFDEIEDEYETVLEDKRRKDSVKLQGWWFMTAVNSIEYINGTWNPFDLNLDGWGEQVNEDIDSYEELFGELHEKYKGGKIAPELSLLLRLGFSAAVVNFTNKALSTSVPGFNDVIRQNPDLMKAFTDATVNSMSEKSPGFAFANNIVNENERPRGPPPPAPQSTKTERSSKPMSRPDISMARDEGLEAGGFQSLNEQQKSARPEMRGPQNSDIDNILSGLKSKNVNIQEKKEDSVISASELLDMSTGKMPKKTQKRKQKSDKSIVTLDL
jgi:hypothetical protein